MGDFSKGGVHKTDGFWWMIFQRGEYMKPIAFDGWFFKGGVHKTDGPWWVIFQRGEYTKPMAFNGFWKCFYRFQKLSPRGVYFGKYGNYLCIKLGKISFWTIFYAEHTNICTNLQISDIKTLETLTLKNVAPYRMKNTTPTSATVCLIASKLSRMRYFCSLVRYNVASWASTGMAEPFRCAGAPWLFIGRRNTPALWLLNGESAAATTRWPPWSKCGTNFPFFCPIYYFLYEKVWIKRKETILKGKNQCQNNAENLLRCHLLLSCMNKW